MNDVGGGEGGNESSAQYVNSSTSANLTSLYTRPSARVAITLVYVEVVAATVVKEPPANGRH